MSINPSDRPKPQRTLLFQKTVEGQKGSSGDSRSAATNLTDFPTVTDHDITRTISVLSYNIWFDEVCTRERMKAIAQIILSNASDVVMLQEVTPVLFEILTPMIARDYEVVCPLGSGRSYGEIMLQKTSGANQRWRAVIPPKSTEMVVRVPFENSRQGRCLQAVEFQNISSATKQVEQQQQQRILLATSHLESLAANSPARLLQLQISWNMLQQSGLPFIFGGDMNMAWADDRAIAVPSSIGDAWIETGSQPEYQHTWDTCINKNLDAQYSAYSRFDRFYCDRPRVQPLTFVTVGKETIVTHRDFGRELYPSDHWGILATFEIGSNRGPSRK